MDRDSFDLFTSIKGDGIKRNNKPKPTQFGSVASGVQKRLESNMKQRKSTRLTTFDNIRGLETCKSPVPPPKSEAQLNVDRRRQALEKWKEEKEMKKKAQAAQKKKPFLTGVPRNIVTFPPPPPVRKPTTSRPVTRSQTRNNLPPQINTVKSTQKGRTTKSFAPVNAAFKPPEIKNLVELPKLIPLSKNKNRMRTEITFDPVLPKAAITVKKNESQQNVAVKKYNSRPKQTDTRSTTRGKVTKKLSSNLGKVAKKPLASSSSGSDIESTKNINRAKAPGPIKPLKKQKALTPKILAMKSSSSEKSTEESEDATSMKSVISKNGNQSSSDNMSCDNPSSVEEQDVIVSSSSSSDSSNKQISNDAEIQEKSPFVLLRRTLPCTPMNKGVPKSESSSEEKLKSPKSVIELRLTPEQMKNSPHVTLSRGKEKARLESMWKLGLLDDADDIDAINYFREQLAKVVDRLTMMSDTWDHISAETELPESVQACVLAAVGQARLLKSSKLVQFASLVECSASAEPGAPPITPEDLQGFWDMVSIEVEKVCDRFKQLEELQSRGWVEAEPEPPARKQRPQRARRGVAAANADGAPAPAAAAAKPAPRRPAGTAGLRDLIAAKRKAQKATEQSSSSAESSSVAATPPAEGEKTFEAGFFCVRSPVRDSSSTTPRTPAAAGKNLLKAVLSSEAKKASASASKKMTPFAILRASIIGKNMEFDGCAPLPQTPQMTPINLNATPGRSILKSAKVASAKKISKAVLFYDSEDSDSQNTSCFRDNVESTFSSVKALENTINQNNNETNSTKDKENSPKVEVRSVRTRRQRKSLQNLSNIDDTGMVDLIDLSTPRRSTRKKKNAEEADIEKKTPVKKSGSKKAKEQEVDREKETPGKKSGKKNVVEEGLDTEQKTPVRKSGRKKAKEANEEDTEKKTPVKKSGRKKSKDKSQSEEKRKKREMDLKDLEAVAPMMPWDRRSSRRFKELVS